MTVNRLQNDSEIRQLLQIDYLRGFKNWRNVFQEISRYSKREVLLCNLLLLRCAFIKVSSSHVMLYFTFSLQVIIWSYSRSLCLAESRSVNVLDYMCAFSRMFFSRSSKLCMVHLVLRYNNKLDN